jgi:hypothetical protein
VKPATSRPASRTDVGDALEPPRRQRRRRGVPWVAILVFLVIAGGGGTAAYILTRKAATTHPTAKAPTWEIPPHAPTFVAGTHVTEAQLEASYDAGFAAVAAGLADLHITLVPPLVDRIVAVDTMCDASNYTLPVPAECKDAVEAIANADPSTLLVIDDPKRLDVTMAQGLADATDAFQAYTVDKVAPGAQVGAHKQIQDALENRVKDFIVDLSKPHK